MNVNILGVRGSTPSPILQNTVYGSNTQCVIIEFADTAIIFDGGTGILNAHLALAKNPNITSVHIFLTHYHIDHILGMTMAPVIFDRKYKITIYAPEFNGKKPQEILDDIFKPPYWPVKLSFLRNDISYVSICEDNSYNVNNAIIKTISLNHPDKSMGFKLCYNNKSIAYILDHEHTEEFYKPVDEFIKAVDLLIFDAPYSSEEYQIKRGYGHSEIDTATAVADNALVKKLLISHHDVFKTDDQLNSIDQALNKYNPMYCLAKEGMVLNI